MPPRSLLDIAQRHGAAGDGGPVGGAARRVPRRPARRAGHRGAVRARCARARASGPALLRDRQRDPGAASCAGTGAARRALPRAPGSGRQGAKTRTGLVTYVNYPSTEYLRPAVPRLRLLQRLPRAPERLDGLPARLQNLAGDRPLLMGELGLDSLRNGEDAQASRSTGRCAPRSRPAAPARSCSPGPTSGTAAAPTSTTGTSASPTASGAQAGAGRGARAPSPRCRSRRTGAGRASRSSSAATTARARIRDCLDGLQQLDYPDFEVIVVDDGSTDAHGRDRAGSTAFRLISTENRGPEHRPQHRAARRRRGEIVAYIDDDAYPDPHWLHLPRRAPS